MLLLQPQLKVLELDNLLFVVVHCLSHAVFLVLDDQQLHLDSLFHVGLTVAHVFLLLEHLLSMGVRGLLELDLAAANPLHSVLFAGFQLTDLVKVKVLHLLSEGFHFVTVFGRLLDANPADFKLFETANLGLQVVLEASLALLFVLKHAVLE